MRVAEFEVHATTNVLELEHGASPGRAGDGHLDRLGTEFGMSGQKSFAAAKQHGGVAVVQGLNLQDGGWRKIAEIDPAFDLRLDDAPVHSIGEIGVRTKHGRDRTLAYRVSGAATRVLSGDSSAFRMCAGY